DFNEKHNGILAQNMLSIDGK
ncbi:TPA: hypothetical protein ACGYQH_001900, partial [Listeria monocytogenes]